jgi:hypothetical protein
MPGVTAGGQPSYKDLNPQHLENIAQDFMTNYKSKVDVMVKNLKGSMQN